MVFDEVHHLASQTYRQIAEMYIAPFRLGLTATYEREDMLHLELPRLTGGVVFRMNASQLSGSYLSKYKIIRKEAQMTQEEKDEYDRQYSIFTEYLKRKKIRMYSPRDFQRFIMRTGYDPDARKALLARNKAMSVALNSVAKIEMLGKLLKENRGEKIIIFTQHNRLVYNISKKYLLPFITHTSSKEERKDVLNGFRDGRYSAIVTSKVLDEGIDVPDASLGIIVSGTGSSREFIQRLGRLLRKKEGKEVKLIEFVSVGTKEIQSSSRRKRRL